MSESLSNYADRTRLARLQSEVLRCLTTVPKEPSNDPRVEQLRILYQTYKSIKAESHEYAIVTIINAILTQRRKYFILTRSNLEACIRADKNLPKKKRKIEHSKYKTVIALLHKLETCKAVNNPEAGTRSKLILEVVSIDLIRLVNLSSTEQEEQLSKCMNFSKASPEKKESIRRNE